MANKRSKKVLIELKKNTHIDGSAINSKYVAPDEKEVVYRRRPKN